MSDIWVSIICDVGHMLMSWRWSTVQLFLQHSKTTTCFPIITAVLCLFFFLYHAHPTLLGVLLEHCKPWSTIILPSWNHFFFLRNGIFKLLFLKENFNLWRPLLMIILYHQIKIPINFWCRWRLNLKSLIQQSETLLVKLTRVYI